MSFTSDRRTLIVAALFSAGICAYHLMLSMQADYGYFIDELYYLACTKRLAFGYVDHPPLSILILWSVRSVFGDSLPAVRLVPALAMGGTTFLTAMITRRLGGSTGAVVIACLGVISMPVLLVLGSFYSMNALEIVTWSVILFLAMRMLDEQNPRYWIPIGILLGLGLELKHTMVVYAIALAAGMALTPARRLLWNRWFAWGIVCSTLLLLPNLVWQAINGFPSLEFYHNAMVRKNISRTPLEIINDQVMFASPFTLPLWGAGLAFLLFSKRARTFRSFGWLYAFLLVAMILSRSSRPDRIAAIYPLLFAAGGVAVASIQRTIVRRSATAGMLVLLTAGLILAAPASTPLLAPPAASTFIGSLGLSLDIERGKTHGALPQWLGDRLGWRELAVEVARVCHALPPDEQRNAVILTTGYGGAGALELYGPGLGLPPVFARQNSYHMWGPPADSIRTYIILFFPRQDFERGFETVEEAGLRTCEYCTRPQQRVPIFVARGPKFSMQAEWPNLKSFD